MGDVNSILYNEGQRLTTSFVLTHVFFPELKQDHVSTPPNILNMQLSHICTPLDKV